jgi:hypothetical protein
MGNLFKKNQRVFWAMALVFSGLPLAACGGELSDPLCETDRLLRAYTLTPTANNDGGSSGLAYYLDATTNTAVVGQGTCTDAAVSIPATYNTSYSVVGVNASGFANDTALTSITFASSSTITLIGSQAFLNTGLTSFTLPANVSVVNPSTFMSCRALTSFAYETGSTCTAIMDHAFTGDVKLASEPFPSGLLSVGDAAFQGCLSLVRAIFPAPFTTLGEAAYENCVSLGLIYFQSAISSIGSFAFKNCPKAWAFFSGNLPSGYTATGQWWNYLYGSYSGTTSAPTTNSAGTVLSTAADFVPVYTNKSTLNYTDGFYYTKYKTTDPSRDYDIVIILYNGTSASNGAGTVDLTIPNTITDDDGTHRVIGIDNSAFASHTELKSVIFNANLQFINDKGFVNCSNIATIGFAGATSLTTIGSYAFSSDNSAAWTGVTSLSIPAKVTSIGTYAFAYYSNLASLTFTGTSDNTSALTSIGANAFLNAGSNFSGSNATNGAVVFPQTLTKVGDAAFNGARFLYSLSFKSTTTLAIGSKTFQNAYYLTAVTLPTSATTVTLDSYAFGLEDINATFNGKTLHSIYLASNVTKVGSKAFQDRMRLTIYCAATSKPSGYNNAFASFDAVSLGDSVTRAALPVYYNVGTGTGKRNLLHYTNATNGEFDFLETTANATTSIVTRYYYDGSSTVSLTPTVPSSVTINGQTNTPTSIGNNAFIISSINGTVNPGTNTMWNSNATSCLTKLTLPNSIVSIGDFAFTSSVMLTNIGNGTDYTFPTSLTTLGASAFVYTGLLKAYLPSVTSIDSANPFLGCFQLAVLQVNSDATATGQTYYSNNNNIYKASTGNNYNELVLGADGASTFSGSSIDTIAWGCTTIDNYSYRGQRKVTSIRIPYTATGIGTYFIDSIGKAFDAAGNSIGNALTDVRFYTNDSTNYPTSRCQSIGEVAFWGCSKLTTMEFPNALTSIGNQAFTQCGVLSYCPTTSSGTGTAGLLDLSGTSIGTIGTKAFEKCYALTKIVLPSALTSISDNCFLDCSGVTSLTLGSQTTTIASSAFNGCKALKAINLPSTVTNVGENAFSGATSATSITFADLTASSGITLNNACFQNCSKVTSIVVPKGVIFPSGQHPFWGCTGLVDASATTGTQKGVFFKMTGAEYSAVWGGNIPSGWNYYKSGTPFTSYACHATTSAEANCSADKNMKYWHYVGGVPTIGVGADS